MELIIKSFLNLLSNLLENSLPQNEDDFTKILGCFFPNHYDIKILTKEREDLQGSLNKLARYLDIMREGKNHQAGSDSLVTLRVFWKLIKYGYISQKKLKENKNILFGILEGKDNEETINYTKINYGLNLNNNNINNIVQKYNDNNLLYFPYERNAFNMNMNMNMNLNLNYYYSNYMMSGLNNRIYNLQMFNNKNNILQYC